MEQKKEVKTYKIYYICDKCGQGKMLSTGYTLLSNPPQYPHKCTKCGFETIFRIKYPRIEHEEKYSD